ncbi:DNA alkylation response protein [Nocardioides sp. zg-579]|uniref:DNA alkylation response protein n=1 Tax=Nocardioides marmotae TaxID=2663857 RepID=A0A6I3JER4_9ACTN|nr:acyl-CoA dehydrogenase family protein [Nocardioides marmotae]MCR6032999.1 DNA alkylation response protein [Gordonia jinghuaiqii]MTB96650.1 DNA alkylation response protein [Nocardioides marmotae]QKE01842.1 DNA alkylation response protein [Nocardioides marmotae]
MRTEIRVTTNQAPPLVGHNVVTADRALAEAVLRHGSPEVLDDLVELGAQAGSAEAREHGQLANEHHPRLTPYDRYGNRIDEVVFHPSWHWLMERAVGHGLGAAPWVQQEAGAAHAHVRRAAGFMAWSHTEPGHGCPISMTYAAVPALRADEAIAKEWTPLLASTIYDPGVRRPADKRGALAGMGMTEKQGGSDVRANITRARPTSIEGTYTLHGHKWFTSAPMNDVFLVLAQAEGGVTCFVVPRVLPDGTRNQLDVVRLKDKLGNRSNASSELELDGTVALRLGDEGRGVRTIIEMVAATRLDCVLGSTGLMRRAVSEASWHAAHRSAFGSTLAAKPLMQNVLADLAVETEAATALALRLASAVDHLHDPHEAALRRIALPLAKFWVCKRTPAMVGEALECLGGNGYVEESVMPLLYREAPLNSVWEGSGNVNALDVLRALAREPEALDAWITEVGRARGGDVRLDRAIDDVLALLGSLLGDPALLEVGARRLAGRMAAVLQGSLLVRFGPPEVADVFCASRLGSSYDGTYGALAGGDLRAIVERTTPVI